MNKRRGLWTFVGFTLSVLGIVSLCMDMVATPFGIMEWTKTLGRLGDFVLKILFIFGGIVVVVLANGNDDEATDEYLGDEI